MILRGSGPVLLRDPSRGGPDLLPPPPPPLDRTWIFSLIGGPYRRRQDSFMYREEHGVASFMLDDDNCECYASLHAGHGMCSGGFSANIGTKNVFGVGLLDRNNCDIGDGPSPSHELYLFYLGMYQGREWAAYCV